jgi:dolichyl-phosphate mannosyltransferase polypeptide 2 regulatory subunit
VHPQPLLGSSHPLQAYFPDRLYAFAIPSVLLIAGVVFVVAFVSIVLSRSQKNKKSS